MKVVATMMAEVADAILSILMTALTRPMSRTYARASSYLWRIVNDDGVRKLAAKGAQILEVVALDKHARVPEYAVPYESPAEQQGFSLILQGLYYQTWRHCSNS